MSVTSYEIPSNALRHTETISLKADAVFAWDVIRDIFAVGKRLIPGFALRVEQSGDSRIVSFANGLSVTERILENNDQARRLRYSAIDGPASAHMGVMEVQQVEGAEKGCRLTWTTYFLPAELEELTVMSMQQAAPLMGKTIDAAFANRTPK